MKNIRDAVWGFIIGDALGVPYEFSTRNMMKANPAKSMRGYGTFNQPPGTWSDDTSMMLCVLENIINKGSARDLANLFLRWYRDDYMTPHGELFDIGVTTSTALGNLMKGANPSSSGLSDEFSAGNGSLMRSLPYAFVNDFQQAVFNMTIENKITHRVGICSLSCVFYVKMLRSILDGNDKLEAAEAATCYLQKEWKNVVHSDDHAAEKIKFERIFDRDFYKISESEIKSTGYVINTLEAVVWCFLNTQSYPDAVLKAVNLGGDTDTIAALTGGLAGLYYGERTMPEEWKNQIVNSALIENLLSKINPESKYIS